MKTTKHIFLALAITTVLFSCKKDPESSTPTGSGGTTTTTGSLSLEFENMVGDSELVLTTKNYINQNGDTFNITAFKYYISNIKLTKSDGSIYTESNSYHFLNASNSSSLAFTLPNVPYGTYTGVTFTIGVDSVRNVSGAQTGALDPANGSFWSWSTGYIMVKLEGTSPQANTTTKALTFHVGGFSGTNNVLKTVSPSFGGSTANVSSTVTPEIHFKVDIAQMFKSPNVISFNSISTIHMPGANAKKIADNYASMISVEHIHN